MMSLLNRLKAKMDAPKPTPIKMRLRVTFSLSTGKIDWPSQPVRTERPTAAEPIGSGVVQLREEEHQHLDCTCTHCGGSGRYINFKKGTVGKCFRCDGKGTFTEADHAFIHRRTVKREAICNIAGF